MSRHPLIPSSEVERDDDFSKIENDRPVHGSPYFMKSRSVMLMAPRGEIQVVDGEAPDPVAGEVLVQMEACGVCHSDLFVAGLEKLKLAPVTLGHEGIGRVAAAGPGVSNVHVGDRVGITFLGATCGSCDLCRRGRSRYCGQQANFGYTMHGAMSTAVTVKAQHLAKIPDGLDPALAAPLCCAGWTAFGALREANLAPGQWVGIFGMGGLGHLAVQYARVRGLRVAVSDPAEAKLEQARALGAEFTVGADDAGKRLLKEIGGMDASVILTGAPSAIQQGFRALKRNGRAVLVGLSTNTYELPIVDTVLKGVEIRGSYLGSHADLTEVMRLAAEGTVKPHVERFGIEEAPSILERLKKGEQAGRAVIVF
jgi:propanol-preferring alcohol dehydrogenase